MDSNSESSTPVVGHVTEASGTVIAIKPDGTQRVLEAGSTVYLNEKIVTEAGSTAVVTTQNNQTLDLGGQEQLLLTQNLWFPQQGEEEPEAPPVEEAQAAIAEGADPTNATDVSAAGKERSEADNDSSDAPPSSRANIDLPVIEREVLETQTESAKQDASDRVETSLIDASAVILPEELEDESESEDESAATVNFRPIAQSSFMEVTEDGSVLQGQLKAIDGNVGELMTFRLISAPQAGLLTLAEDGSFQFSPASDFDYLAPGENSEVSFVFEVIDSQGSSSQSSVTINIEGVNDTPEVEGPITLSASQQDGEITLNLLHNATDKDSSDNLSITNMRLVSGNEEGISISLAGDEVIIDPEAYRYLAKGETETITYEYRVTDSSGDYTTQTASITLSGTNDLPEVEGAIVLSTHEDANLLDINLLTGLSDVDATDSHNLVSLRLTAGDPQGVTLSGDSEQLEVDSSAYAYLAQGESETLGYTYEIDDGHGETINQTASITIEGRNDTPDDIAISSLDLDENVAGSEVGLLTTSDTDHSDTHTYTVDDNRFEVVEGQLRLKTGISLDHEMEDRITVNVTTTDNYGATHTEAFTLNVNDINETPVSQNQSQTIDEDSLYRFALSDFPHSDVDDGDQLESVVIDSLPEKGILELSGTAIITGVEISRTDIESGNLTFLPDAHESGDGYASFVFRVNDGELSSSPQTFSINVVPVADEAHLALDIAQPEASFAFNDYEVSSPEDEPVSLPLSSELTDSDGSEILALTLSGVPEGSELTDGVQTLIADGRDIALDGWQIDQLQLTPPANRDEDFTLTFNSITTEVSTGQQASVVKTLHVNLLPVDDAPVAGGIDLDQTLEDTQFTITEAALLANAKDIDGDSLSISSVTLDNPALGLVSNNGDGSWTFAPSAHFHGDNVSFTFAVSDGTSGDEATAQAVLDVVPVNDAPNVAGAVDSTATEDSGIQTIDLLAGANDVDVEDTLSITQLNLLNGDDSGVSVSGSTLEIDTSAYQHLGEGTIETLTYVYSISDGQGGTVPQFAQITLTGSNDAAVISGVETGTVTEDDSPTLSTSGSLTISDADNDESTFQPETLTGNHGQLVIDASGNWVYTADNSQSSIQQLSPNSTLTDTFTICALDGTEHTVTTTIHGNNDAPILTSGVTLAYVENDGEQAIDSQITLADIDSVTIDSALVSISSNYVSSEDSLGFVDHNGITGSWDVGTGSLSLTGTATVAQYQEALRTITYSNSSESPNTSNRTIIFSVYDGHDTSNIASSTVTITAVNDAPETTNSGITTDEDTPYIFSTSDFQFTDVDFGDALEGIQISQLPESGRLTFNNTDATVGLDISRTDLLAGRLKFEPALHEHGNQYAAFEFKVSDGEQLSDSAILEISVTAVNDNPETSEPLSLEVTEDSASFHIDLLEHASDVDIEDTLSVNGLSLESGNDIGISTNGNVLTVDSDAYDYLPEGQTETILFNFDVVDGNGGSAAQSVTIRITGTNDGAQISGVNQQNVSEDAHASTLTVSGSLTITDQDTGESVFIAETISGNYGSLVIDENGSWSYSADNTQNAIQSLGDGDSLTDSIEVTAADGSSQTITITINGTNDVAVIGGVVTGLVTEDASASLITSGALTITDTDSGEASFNAENVSGTYGFLTVDVNGNWSYSADNNQTAIQALGDGDSLTDSIIVTALDGTSQTITITINGTNDVAMIGGVNTSSVTEDAATTLTTSGALTISDIDSGEASFNAENVSGTYGSLTVDANGNWSYSADNTQAAIQSLGDGDSLTDSIIVTALDGTSQTITITINGTNDTAVIGGVDTGSVTEDASATLTTSGVLTITDTDSGEANFNAETVTGSYGSLTVDANGNWTYSADNTQAAIQSLGSGGSLTDSVEVTAIDGSSQTITITINGTNDVAVIGGVVTGSVTEDASTTLITSGALTITDTDSGEAAFNAETITGTYGSLTIDANGNWNYSADNTQTAIQALADGDSLTDNIEVTATDGTSQTITITINGTNDAAVLGGIDTGSVTEDTSATLTTSGVLTITDTDSGEANFNAETVTGAYGSLTVDANGNWTYSADNTQAAIQSLGGEDLLTDSIEVTAIDGSSQTITITINGTNDVAVTGGVDTGSVTEDASTTLTTSGALTITDIDSGEAAFSADTISGTYGSLVIDESGNWNYSADNTQTAIQALAHGDSLTDSIEVTAIDGSSQTITITINGTNDVALIGGVVTGSVTEDASATLTISGALTITDTDSGEASFNAETVSGTYGSLTVDANGNWSYSADNTQAAIQALGDGDSLTDSIIVTALDGTSQTITITINGTNDTAMIGGVDTGSVAEDATATLTTSGVLTITDTDSGEANFNAETVTGSYGSLTVDANGNWTYSADNTQAAIQSLGSGGSLTDSVEVTAIDGSSQTITITINGTNDVAMIGGVVMGSVTEDASATLTISGALTITDTDSGEASFNAETVSGTYGSLTVHANGNWSYSADNTQTAIQALGDGDSLTDSIEVTAADGTSQTITITIYGTNDAAVIGGVDTGSVTEDDFSSYGPLGEQQLITNGSLIISDIDTEAEFVDETITGSYGELTINSNGQWQYIADSRSSDIQELGVSETLADVITVQAADGTPHNITITIQGANDQSQGGAIYLGTLAEDNSLIINESSITNAVTDIDGDTLTVSNILLPGGGHTIVNNNDGTWTLTPAPNFNGLLEMLYVVSDGTLGYEVNNLVRVNIIPAADTAVISGDDSGTVTEDSAATLTSSGVLSVSDPDSGEAGFNAETVTGTYGSLIIDAAGNWTYSADDSQSAIQALKDGESLTDTVSVSSIDGTSQNITITINGINDIASSADQTITLNEDSTYTFSTSDFSFSDTDSSDSLQSITITQLPVNGELKLNGVAVNVSDSINTADIGNLTFTPTEHSNGDAYASLQFTVSDGTANSSAQTLTFDVTAVNDPPTAPAPDIDQFDFTWGGASMNNKIADTYALPSDFSLGDSVWVHQSDDVYRKAVKVQINDNGDGTLNFKAIAAAYTTLSNWNSLSAAQQETFFESGSATSQPIATSNSESGYGISDIAIHGGTPVSGFLDSGTGMDIHPFFVAENGNNGAVAGTVVSTDIEGNALTFSLSNDAGGRFSINSSTGEITVADSNRMDFEAAGTHTITVEVSDGSLTSSRDYSIYIQDTNDAPELLSSLDNQSTAEEAAFSYTLPESAFGDQDNDTIFFSATLANGDPLPAWLSFDPDTRTFSGTPDDPDIGTLSVKITLSDGTASTDAIWLLEVTAINDAPMATDDTNTGEVTTEGSVVTGSTSVLDNDTDTEGDAITVIDVNGTAVSGSTTIAGDFGDLTITADGNWTYTPATLDLATALVGQWTFDGNTLDSAPADSVTDTGVLEGGVTTTGSGLHGSSLNLIANGGAYLLDASSEIDGTSVTNRTINLSFRIDDANSLSGRQVLFEEGGTTRGLNAYIDGAKLYIGGYDTSVGWSGTWYSTDLPSDNDFHNIALVLGSNQIAGYLDGSKLTDVAKDISTGTRELSQSHQEFVFGARHGDMSFHDGTHDDTNNDAISGTFIGEIDEARIYNRTLSNQEIKALNYEFQSIALQDAFTYTVSDGDKNDTATLTIDINRTPQALNGTLAATEDGDEIVGQVFAMEFDHGDTVTYSVESQPSEGSVTVNPDGIYSFFPDNDFQDLGEGETRDVTFDYRATDNQGDFSTATVTVTVTGSNDAATFTSVESDTEDFNILTTGDLNGQDGWITEEFNPSSGMQVTNIGHDGSAGLQFNQVSASVSASKLNTIPDLTRAKLFAFEVDAAKNWWGTQIGIGADNNADGKIGKNDSELAIAIKPSDHNDQLQLLLADGSTLTVAFAAADGNGWVSFRVEIDLEANSGAGTVTVKYKDLSASDTTWNTVSGLENINAGLDTTASDHTNPGNWNGVYISGDGGGVKVDNLSLEAQRDQSSASVTEDTDVDGSNNLVKSGLIIVSDADSGEGSFNAETLSGNYGSLTIDTSGNWTYTADNTQIAIQSLNGGDQLSETFTVSSLDGTTHDISLTINGTEDAPELSSHVPISEVVAAYDFDDTNDNTGNGNKLTLSGSATLSTGYGETGTALAMDGTSGYADISGLETGGAMSVSTWVKFDSFSQAWSRVFDFADGQANNNILLGHAGTTNELSFHIYQGQGSPADAELNIPDFFTAGEWVHVTATIGSDGTMSIYKNGELAGQTAGVVPATMVRANNFIGKSNWSADGHLDGSVDEFAVFNKELSAAEIKAIYQNSNIDNLLNDALHIEENSANATVVGTVTATDIENDSLTYSLTDDADGRFTIDSDSGEISVADSSLLDHDSNASHTITVQVNDGTLSNTRDYTIDVTNIDEAPTASDNMLTTSEDISYTLTQADLGYSDEEGAALSAVEITTLPASGTLNLSGVAVTLNQQITRADIESGNLVFVPAANEAGDGYTTVGFKVSDGSLWSDNAYTLTFNVNAIADKPVLGVDAPGGTTDDQLFSSEFTSHNMDGWSGTNFQSYTINGSPNHRLDNGQTISRTIDTANGNDFILDLRVYDGYATGDSTQLEVVWDGNVVATLNPVLISSSGSHNQTVTLPAPGTESGTLSLRTVNGGSTYLDNIRVYEELPNLVVNEDVSGSMDLSLALTDVDNSETLTLTVSGLPAGAIITDGLNSMVSTGADVDITGWNTDTLSLTPAADDHTDFKLVFTATATEASNSDSAAVQNTIAVTVNPVMDAPVSADNSLLLRQGDSYTFKESDFSFNDVDSSDSLQSITIIALPSSGTLTLNGAAVTANQVISTTDITNLVYNASASGEDLNSSFTFTVSDGSLSSSTQIFDLNIRGTYSENLLTNAGATEGTTGWNIIENGGSGWGIEGTSHDGDGKSWGTSYAWDKKSQTINLLANGFTADYLDTAPAIDVSDWFKDRHNNDSYYLKVQLRDASNNVIASYDTGTLTATDNWQEASQVFTEYGSGVRYIYFEHGGKDSEIWNGRYGARIDDSQVYVELENEEDVTLAGTDSTEIIDGSLLNDSIKGNAGNDIIYGDLGTDTIDAGAGNDTVSGDDASAIPINLDSSFISQANQITLPPATGLKGEFFETSTVFGALSEAVALTTNSTPKATFTASSFNYAKTDGTLSGFLGSDAASLSGHGNASDETFALKLTGYIRLSAGTHDFNVTSDDGFSLKINNQTVTEFTAPRAAATSSGNYTAPQDGLYEVELIYWQDSSGADMNITSNSLGTMEFYDALPAGAVLVDGQTYYDLPTPDITVDVADGVTLSAGTNNGDGTWTLKEPDLSGLTMTSSDKSWDDSLTFTMTKDTKRTISIIDSSFENVGTLSNGGYIHQPSTRGWTFSSSSDGIHDYDSSAFNDQSADGTGGEEAPDGYNAAFINSDGAVISQTLSENFDRNTDYQLQVDIGNRKNYVGMGDYEVRITAGGVTLVSDGSLTPAEGEFETLTIDLDGSSIAADSAVIGQPITIELVKNSGDQVAFDNVRLTATTTERITRETINTDQSDQITGGEGDDILTGGYDSDTFIWHVSDAGTAASPAEDTITDFHVGQGGDVLNLGDLLVDEENHQLDEYLHFNFSNGDTTLEISSQANGDVTQKVKLEGVDLSNLGATDSDIINNLLNDGNLQVDQ